MKQYKIKILENTPIHNKYTQISLEDFRNCYPTIVNEYNTDKSLIHYLRKGYGNDNVDLDYSKWFEVIEINKNNFQIGNWI